MNLTAHINIETPDGLRLAKELAGHPEDVIIETPVGSEKFYTLDEVFDKSLTKMRTHYGDEFAKNYEKDFRNRFCRLQVKLVDRSVVIASYRKI